MQPKNVILWIVAAIAAIVTAVAAVLFLPKAESTTPEQTTSAPTTPSDEESVNPAVQEAKDSFTERVKAFEQTLRSFDYQESESLRHERLAKFMLPEALDVVIETDLAAAHIRDLMRKTKAMKVATVRSTPVSDLDEDLVDAETEVAIRSEQADDSTIYNDELTSTTTWVKVEGVWMVSAVDPYA